MRLMVLFQKRNVVLGSGRSLFPRCHAMRFQWIALLAYARKMQPARGGWVRVEDIQRLPLWVGRTRHHVGTNVGRYVQQLQASGVRLVEARTAWRGPYRILATSSEIEFDVPVDAVGDHLGLAKAAQDVDERHLRRFVQRYARASSLFVKGHLHLTNPKPLRSRRLTAWRGFADLAADRTLSADLRVMAHVGEARTLDRLGRFAAVKDTLLNCRQLVDRATDPYVKARFHLAIAWCWQRAGDHAAAQDALAAARSFLPDTLDQTILGAAEDRDGLHLAASGKYREALPHLLRGLRARLFAENYDAVQASTFNIGQTLHEMGEQHYQQANAWLKLSLDVARWHHVGRDDALPEIILAKIAAESGDSRQFNRWIIKAEERAREVQNLLDVSTCHLVRALELRRRGRSDDVVQHLVRARRVYCNLKGYDWQTRDAYARRKFPELWAQVLERSRTA